MRGTDPARRTSGVFEGIHARIGATSTIGRDPACDVVVDDLLASRRHAELRQIREDEYELVDLASTNGTFVNGRRIERAVLGQLDVVAIGHHMFRLVGAGLEKYLDDGKITFQASGLGVRLPAGATLLDDVTFSLEERSFLAVCGPSGAGKSTLLNALTGFRPANQGEVLYDGRDLYSNYDELRTRIGFVPQQDILHGSLTIDEELGFAAELRFSDDAAAGERRDRIAEVIGELGLGEANNVAIRHLSGGQRRRVAVAIELMTRPSLLFLDEPTSGLDPGYERSVMELLRGLADGGRTVVVVTHSLQSIRLCDRVLFLVPGGRTAYFGPPQLASAYFGREDFHEIFSDLTLERTRDWAGEFAAHEYHQRYVERAAPAPIEAEAPRSRRPILARPQGLVRQFSMLTRRQIRVIASDRRNLALLCLQPLVLGLIMLAVLPGGEFAAPGAGEVRAISRAGLVLLVLALGATWLGASNAVRTIVEELPILSRERAVGLSVLPYIASKATVLGALTTVQVVVMVAIALARQGSYGEGSVVSSPFAELMAAMVLAGLAGMALGLLISAVSSTVDRAMTVLPVVLILQLLLAIGGLFPDLVDKPVLKQASYGASAQWAFSATASTVDLGRLQTVDGLAREAPTVQLDDPVGEFEDLTGNLDAEPRWNHDASAWAGSAAALVALTIAGLVAAGVAVRRRRPEA